MYMGQRSQTDYDLEWVKGIDDFLDHAFGE